MNIDIFDALIVSALVGSFGYIIRLSSQLRNKDIEISKKEDYFIKKQIDSLKTLIEDLKKSFKESLKNLVTQDQLELFQVKVLKEQEVHFLKLESKSNEALTRLNDCHVEYRSGKVLNRAMNINLIKVLKEVVPEEKISVIDRFERFCKKEAKDNYEEINK